MHPDHRVLHRPFLAALLLCGLAAPIATGKEKMTDPADKVPSALDPRQYLSIFWNEEPLVKPCKDPYPPASGADDSCLPASEIVGGRGTLRIDFDREHMKELWDFDTRGSLSIRGYVDSASKGRRNIEIPGYSLIGTELTVVDMDLSAAFDLVSQLSQAILLADRIQTAVNKAELADLKAQLTAVDQLIAAERQTLNESELALRRIYTEALRFTLSVRDVTDAAEAIAKARAAQAAVEQPGAVGSAAKLDTFFREVQPERVTIESWLNELLADENRPYFPIIARIVGRSEDVIRDVAKEVQGLFESLRSGELTPEARATAMNRLDRLSSILLGIQENIFLHYRNLNGEALTRLEASPQYVHRMSTEFNIRNIKTVRDLCAEKVMGCKGGDPDAKVCEECTESDAKPNEEIAADRAAERLQALQALLEKLTGTPAHENEVEKQALKNFTSQILSALEATQKHIEKRDALSKEIALREHHLDNQKCKREECRSALVTQGQDIEALLMIEIINTLIDAIPPVTLSLDSLDLDDGDRLGIVVSLLPRPKPDSPPPPQLTYEFLVSPFGWSGPRPRIRDVLTFVQADAPDQDFAPRPGVTALWNFYGKSKKQKSALRAIAPGFGLSASFLDFDDQEETIEVGLGLTVSLFDDLLHFTYGYNLQKELGENKSRKYFGIGISLTQVVNKFKKEEK